MSDRTFAEETAEQIIINELRGKVDRRNALLDVIRKAYHRDVLVVKECLIDAQRQGLDAKNASTTIKAPLGSTLASVPSIDLRETFRLFAPQECELRVRPCWSCGGQLEVIHRESARIVNFKHSIRLLEEKEKDLRMELVNTKVEAREDRNRLVEVMERSQEERDVLLEQILSLKRQVADRNALDAEVKQLRSDKKHLEATLERQQPILDDHARLVVKIKDVEEDASQWEAKFHDQVEHNAQVQNEKESLAQQLDLFQRENEELKQSLQDARLEWQRSDDRCTALAQDLASSKASAKELEACLRKAEHAMEELETEFHHQKHQMERRIGDLEAECSDAQSRIIDLEGESRKNAEEASQYRKRIEVTLEGARRRGSIAFVPRDSDAAFAKTDELICELDNQRHKTAALSNLLLGCIRSTYENCLVQEKLLLDNGSELHRNQRKIQVSQEPTNDKARMVLEHLGSADESDVIEWVSILADETDQRHVLGNLQNRLQMGQFSLDKAFQKISKEHSNEMRKLQDEHNKLLEERRSRVWELEKMNRETIAVNRQYEDKIIKQKSINNECIEPMIDSVRRALRKIRRECCDNNDALSKLREDYERLRTLANSLLDELRSSRRINVAQEKELVKRQADIRNRDSAMKGLEELLQSITSKYAENERRRMKVMYEIGVQAVPATADATALADFLPTPLRGVVPTDPENTKRNYPLLPGRILKIKDDNWPSRISVGSGLMYRRAIDKL